MSSFTGSARVDASARSDDTRIHAERRLLTWLFLLMAATFLVFQQGVVTGYDGGTMYEVTKSMVDRGTTAVPEEWNALPGRDGLAYSRYGLGLSIVAALPYALSHPIGGLLGRPEDVSSAAVASVMPFIAAALVAAMYLLARRMGARVGWALIVAVGAVVGTFMLPYSKEFFSEPLATLFLVVGIERMLAGRAATAGLAMGAAVLTRPQTLLFAPVLVLVAWRQHGRSGLVRTVTGLAPGLILTFAYNVLRFQDPLLFGYQDSGFTTPFIDGARGLLFEPTKSVLLFAPVVVLLPFALRRLWREDRPAFVLIGGNLAITFVMIATWFAWHGGWCWGPRLLLPGIIPAIAAIGPWLSTATRRRAGVLLFAAGFLISFPGLIVSTQAQQFEVPSPPPWTHFLDTQPLASPSVVRQFELISANARYTVDHLYEDQGDGKNNLRSLSVWQFGVIRVLGRAGLAVSMAGTALLLIIAVWCYWRLRPLVQQMAEVDHVESGFNPPVADHRSSLSGFGEEPEARPAVSESTTTRRGDRHLEGLRVAVLLPCRNEEQAIADVVLAFKTALPTARVYVYDNASTDRTVARALEAGALVHHELRRGKGNVVCRMFADIDADVYVMADGDGTYDASAAPGMVRLLVDENLDMVVGRRTPDETGAAAFPRGHVAGNWLFNRLLKMLFGADLTDVFSGYRVMSRRFVKSFPVRFTGFEIETELATHTIDIGLPYAEVATTYRPRHAESKRKLRTFRDGLRIMVAAVLLFKEMRPLRFFTLIAVTLTVVALVLGLPVVEEYLDTGLVPRLPTAVLSASIQVIAFICLTAGLVLDSVCRMRREAKRLVYLALPAVNPSAARTIRSASGANEDVRPVTHLVEHVVDEDDDRPEGMR
jgi:Glycosyl transferase family 2